MCKSSVNQTYFADCFAILDHATDPPQLGGKALWKWEIHTKEEGKVGMLFNRRSGFKQPRQKSQKEIFFQPLCERATVKSSFSLKVTTIMTRKPAMLRKGWINMLTIISIPHKSSHFSGYASERAFSQMGIGKLASLLMTTGMTLKYHN